MRALWRYPHDIRQARQADARLAERERQRDLQDHVGWLTLPPTVRQATAEASGPEFEVQERQRTC